MVVTEFLKLWHLFLNPVLSDVRSYKSNCLPGNGFTMSNSCCIILSVSRKMFSSMKKLVFNECYENCFAIFP